MDPARFLQAQPWLSLLSRISADSLGGETQGEQAGTADKQYAGRQRRCRYECEALFTGWASLALVDVKGASSCFCLTSWYLESASDARPVLLKMMTLGRPSCCILHQQRTELAREPSNLVMYGTLRVC
ncbi:uncharacterized protein EV422DRAFT_148961 [Fimicolochytrium jonesii]|uniref:uncharacterized protein n=1 Tax=Fimicolochytrium jonesii TaxID=1396493 RepID=UPI0022FDC03D|nr:uncharacterized protein EV422DRAFT_148961 [Fimicolochytrium jonesii]KAI8825995.1 hypothetical protein EV422DRAFT_148961 [Fimicolochytrium jonesii]